jgi:CheY-like chemotaxis protein
MRCLDQRRYVGWGGTPGLTHCCHADLTQVETISQSDAWFGVNTRPRSERSVILIVEDEALIRLGAVQIAEDEGFEVIEAANADEAIEILESRNDIRVIFTDIHMPGSMDGLKLAHAVRHRWPPIKIIVTSGREYLSEHDLPEGGHFFPKPYAPVQVQAALRKWA